MVSICGQLILVIVVLGIIVIEGSFSVSHNRKNGENSASLVQNKDINGNLEMIHKEALLENDTSRSFKKNTNDFGGVARKKSDKGGSIMNQIIPMSLIPFLVSSSLIPAMLLSIKFLMIKSAIIGKIAVILMLMNFFRRRGDTGGVYNHYPMDLAKEHYGYQGVEEPGVYINKKRRRKRHLR